MRISLDDQLLIPSILDILSDNNVDFSVSVNLSNDPSDVAGNLELSTSEASTQSVLPQCFADARINFTSNTTLEVSATIPN
jgi:hypothetical protein